MSHRGGVYPCFTWSEFFSPLTEPEVINFQGHDIFPHLSRPECFSWFSGPIFFLKKDSPATSPTNCSLVLYLPFIWSSSGLFHLVPMPAQRVLCFIFIVSVLTTSAAFYLEEGYLGQIWSTISRSKYFETQWTRICVKYTYRRDVVVTNTSNLPSKYNWGTILKIIQRDTLPSYLYPWNTFLSICADICRGYFFKFGSRLNNPGYQDIWIVNWKCTIRTYTLNAIALILFWGKILKILTIFKILKVLKILNIVTIHSFMPEGL